jgi:hypothetical protein
MERAEAEADLRAREPGRAAEQEQRPPPPQEYTRIHRVWSSEPYTRPNQPPVPFVDTEVTDTERAEQIARVINTEDIRPIFQLGQREVVGYEVRGSNDPPHQIQYAPVAGPTDRRVANHMIRIRGIIREQEIVPDYPPFFATQTDRFVEDFFDTIYPGLTEATIDERMRRFRALIDHPNKDNAEFFKTYVEDKFDDTAHTIRPATYNRIHIYAIGDHGELAAPDLIFDKASYIQIDRANRLRLITYDINHIELMRLFFRDINFRRAYMIKTFCPNINGHHSFWHRYEYYVIDNGVWLTDSNGIDVIGLMVIFNPPVLQTLGDTTL